MRFLVLLLPVLVASPAIAGLISPVLVRRIDSPLGFSRYGQSVDVADLDADGVLDFAIGGNGVRVVSGADGSILLSLDSIGDEVDFVGDVDGDGTIDLVVGDVSQQSARLVSGKTGQIQPIAFSYVVGSDEGESISALSDVDGDMVPDFAIGDAGAFGSGRRTRVYSGRLNRGIGFVDSGHSVASLGDVNGDGRGDFVAGRDGDIQIFSGASLKPLFSLPGNDAVLAGCDVDGDGIQDALLSMPHLSNGSVEALVVSYSGATGAFLDSVVAFTEPIGSLGFFRGFVTGLGDVDGDGHEDFAASFAEATYGGNPEAGAVGVFSGATGERLAIVGGTLPGMHFGWSVDGPGDVDGDGVPDLVVGAPDGAEPGRVDVYRLKRGPLTPLLEFDPGVCPNRVPTNGNQDLELAFLGGGEFDLDELDAATVRLDGIAPKRERSNLADVEAGDGESCGCDGKGKDGLGDRVFRFDAGEVRARLRLGQERSLPVTAGLFDGRVVQGEVCVVLARRTNGVHLDGDVTPKVQPNPAERGATIRLALPGEAPGDLISVHDIRGRRVALVRTHEGFAEWNTRDEHGALVPAGIYLLRCSGRPAGRLLIVSR